MGDVCTGKQENDMKKMLLGLICAGLMSFSFAGPEGDVTSCTNAHGNENLGYVDYLEMCGKTATSCLDNKCALRYMQYDGTPDKAAPNCACYYCKQFTDEKTCKTESAGKCSWQGVDGCMRPMGT